MTSLCGHVKALISEWVIERMGEKHHNEERERSVAAFLRVCVVPFFLSVIGFHF